jgi:ATP-dependent helicase HrpB
VTTPPPDPTPDALPVDAAIPALIDALSAHGRAVLTAPPGAGKTTRMPLALLPRVPGRILMLEPRRLAARAAAERMAAALGEAPGKRVGYRMRGDTRVTSATRIEVVTEAILTRMIQSDPDLPGVSAVIFDEFHERSLHADLGLALAIEARAALRPDLMILVMSATLDAGPVAALLDDAPLIAAEGRAFPVETRWLDRPLGPAARIEPAIAARIETALADAPGSLLAFLPGEGEIRRVAALLTGRLPPGCSVEPLFGAMPPEAQRAVLAPAPPGARKVVLATSIAETSLTLPDIRIVVDGGRARRSRFDPASGMARLVTERVTRAEADQRRGRAGRVAPGVCHRLWTRGEEGALGAFPPPEIVAGDLAPLALELALWGGGQGLCFLTPPPEGPLSEARALLRDLGALDGQGRITAHGRALAALPLHPRLAHMLVTAGPQSADLAALLADRDPFAALGTDLAARLALIRGRANDPAALPRIRAEAARLGRLGPPPVDPTDLTAGEMAALAYPDRIALRRPGADARYVLSGGKGAHLDPADPLARHALIVATDLDGDPREARIRAAAPLTDAALRRRFGPRIERRAVVEWSHRDARVIARTEERLGALVLSEAPLARPAPDAIARAALDGLRDLGLPWTDAARRFRDRVMLVRRGGADLPDLSDAALLDDPDWLLPALGQTRTAADLRALDMLPHLRACLDHAQTARLDRLAPASFTTPLGRALPIDYSGDQPEIALRLQELFGLTTHPTVGPNRTPLKLTLLSPAGRPIQVTTDLPRFWTTSYADVRRDMRGQYPKHPWPEDPAAAAPTLRARPRQG